jgi:hypothetical protein
LELKRSLELTLTPASLSLESVDIASQTIHIDDHESEIASLFRRAIRNVELVPPVTNLRNSFGRKLRNSFGRKLRTKLKNGRLKICNY